MWKNILSAVVLSVFIAITCTYASDCNVPSNETTIQACINKVGSGDSVFVSSGTYKEIIDFKGKAITLESISGAERTIIDGDQKGSVVTITGVSDGQGATLRGFTITNGKALSGGGVMISGNTRQINIEQNTITNNASDQQGGGVFSKTSSSSRTFIIKNKIINNNARMEGGGVFGDSCSSISDNTISANIASDGGGIFITGESCSVEIYKNSITDNNATFTAGGIGLSHLNYYSGVIFSNRIINNLSSDGGGMFILKSLISNFYNNIVAKNIANSGAGILISSLLDNSTTDINFNTIAYNTGGGLLVQTSSQNSSSIRISHTILWNNGDDLIGVPCENVKFSDVGDETCAGQNNNISDDPFFVDFDTDDYHLQSQSICIDAGDEYSYNMKDIDGEYRLVDGNNDGKAKNDIGVDEFYQKTGIKKDPIIFVNLTGCTNCTTGDNFIVELTIKNPSDKAISVEVKAGVITPDGTEFNLMSDKHFEISLSAGLEKTVKILDVKLPDSCQVPRFSRTHSLTLFKF